jgi:hypothetical protein
MVKVPTLFRGLLEFSEEVLRTIRQGVCVWGKGLFPQKEGLNIRFLGSLF